MTGRECETMRKGILPGGYLFRKEKKTARNTAGRASQARSERLALYERLMKEIISLGSVTAGDISRFESDLSEILGRNLGTGRVAVLRDGENVFCGPETCEEGRNGLPGSVRHFPIRFGDRNFGSLRVELRDGNFPRTVEDTLFFTELAGKAGMVLLNRERLDALEKLKESELFLKKAQEVARTGHWRIAIPGNRIEWSEETYRIFGVPSGSPVTLETFYSLVHPADITTVKGGWEKTLRGEPYFLRHRILRGDEIRWVEERAEVEFDPEGKPVAGLGTVRDITLQVNAEQRLELYRQNLENLVAYRTADLENAMKKLDMERSFLSTILHSLSYPFCVIDVSDFSIVIQNDAATSFRPEDTAACHSLFFGKPDPCLESERECPLRKVAVTGLPHVSETSFDQDGVYYKRYCHPVFDREGRVTHVIMYIIDISTDKLLRERLTHETALANELKEMAEAANRSKSAFLSNMSHEIRTPLNAVIGFAHLLKNSPLTAVQKKHADRLLDSSRHLLRLINDVLDFSKIEANRMELDVHDFEPSRHIDQVCALVVEEAARKGLEIRVDLRSIPLVLRGDGGRFAQVLLNLVDNGVKFCDRGEVAITAEAVEWRDTSAVLRFVVSDTGIGMSGEQMERIFTDFMQSDAGMTRKYGGTGLGLAISRQLAEMMGGSIRAESEPGKGSTFSFEVPFGISSSLPEKSECLEPFIGRRALVAERSADDGAILARILNELGMQAEVAPDVSSALEMMKKADQRGSSWDLLFLDSTLPGAGSLLEGSHSLRGKTDLVVLAPFGNVSQGKEQGAESRQVLAKPVTPSRLCDALAQLCSAGEGKVEFPGISAGGAGKRGMGGAHVLLAEDNRVNQEVTCALLESLGISATVAGNGRMAVETFRKTPEAFDLIVMDVQMPVMDGLQATREIRALPEGKHVPIVAMTANAFEEDGRRCIEAGMDVHVSKPLEPDGLMKILARWLPGVRDREDTMKKPPAASAGFIPPELGTISGLNTGAGLMSVRGDVSFFLRLLRQFVDEHGKDGSRIEDDLAAGALESAGKRAHGLRGVTASLGLETVNAVAAKIEKLVRNKRPAEEILPLAESLEQEIGRFAERLADFSAEEEPGKR